MRFYFQNIIPIKFIRDINISIIKIFNFKMDLLLVIRFRVM